VARLKGEFEKRNVRVLGLSVDHAKEQKEWEADIEETQGHAVNFPMVSDSDGKVANLYGMIHPNANDTLTQGVTLRKFYAPLTACNSPTTTKWRRRLTGATVKM